jgi:uncharacterized protein YuzE
MITYDSLPENLTYEDDELESLLKEEIKAIDHDQLYVEHDCEKMLTNVGFIKLIEKRDQKIKDLEDQLNDQSRKFKKEFDCTFDPEYNVGYIRIRKSNKKHFAFEAKNGIVLDYDEDGNLLGIEFLNNPPF